MSNPEETEYGACPKCGCRELISGYGLAFGRGVGGYLACNECDWFRKGLDPDLYAVSKLDVAALRRAEAERLVAAIKAWRCCYPKLKSFSADVVEVVGEDNGWHPMPLFTLCCPEADSKAIAFLVLLNEGWPEREGLESQDEMPTIALPERTPKMAGEYLRGWRICERVGFREAATLAGLTSLELSEMERGKREFELHAVVAAIKAGRKERGDGTDG